METTTIWLPSINAGIDYQNFKTQVLLIFGELPKSLQKFPAKQNLNLAITLKQLLFDGSYFVGLESARTFLKISEQAKENRIAN